jgi:hypothetical protein
MVYSFTATVPPRHGVTMANHARAACGPSRTAAHLAAPGLVRITCHATPEEVAYLSRKVRGIAGLLGGRAVPSN